MKRKIHLTVLCLVVFLVISACGTGRKVDQTGMYIYYVNTNGTGLAKENYTEKYDNPAEEADRMIDKLKNAPESIDYVSAIPEKVNITECVLDGNKLIVSFDKGYEKLGKVEELLCRAAVVQTLSQISGVDFIEFMTDGHPLTDSDGNPVGMMRGEDFIQNTGSSIHNYQSATLNLYFADETGEKLKNETVNVRYNSNISMEKLIVEQLMKGPAKDGAQPTISPEARLLGVSVKDGICYVNFDNGFLNNNYNLKPEIPIYSIVNSIIDSGSASQVQISIAGETDVVFQGTVKLSSPFSRNQEIIEEKNQ